MTAKNSHYRAEMPSARQLRALWSEPSRCTDDQYYVRAKYGDNLIALSKEGHPTLIVQLRDFKPHAGRVLGKVRLRFLQGVRLKFGGETSHADIAAFECLSLAVVDTFSALVSDLLQKFGLESSTYRLVVSAFARWHDLLASSERLSPGVEQGLWGELAVLGLAPMIDEAEQAWNGPKRGVVDFLRGKVGLEVKTGRQRRRHTISFEQALFGVIDYDAFLVSLWVQPNDAGTSLPEQVNAIAKNHDDRIVVEGFEAYVIGE